MTFLLTGETGFLGSVIKQTLSAMPETNLCFLNKKERIDIAQPFQLTISEIDGVIHAAGKAHSVPTTKEEREAFDLINFKGTVHLCDALEQNGQIPQVFVFISTVAVYGLSEGVLINEMHPLKGSTPYALSKIKAETFLQQWADKNQVKLYILRLPLIAGLNPPGNLGAMIKAIRNGRYFSLKGNLARKSIVWAGDIGTIIYNIKDKTPGIYNLTDGYHPSFSELDAAISGSMGKKRPQSIPVFAARLLGKVGDILGKRFPLNSEKIEKMLATLTFDDSKARNNLNWTPSQVLDHIHEII